MHYSFKTPDMLTDDQLRIACDGLIDVEIARDALVQPGNVDGDGYVDMLRFPNWVAFLLEQEYDGDLESKEFEEWDLIHLGWGEIVAANINGMLD